MFLSVTDMCRLCYSLPILVHEYTASYSVGALWCKLSRYVVYTSLFIGIYTIVLMSIDRFSALVFPLKSVRFRTKRNMNIGLAFVLVFSVVINIPVVILYTSYEQTSNRSNGSRTVDTLTLGKCELQTVRSETSSPEVTLSIVYFTSFSIFSYFLPVVSIGAMHMIIFFKLVRAGSLRYSNPSSHAAIHTRAARIVVVIFITFVVCWTPLHVIYSLFLYTDLQNQISLLQLNVAIDASNAMATLNSCANPYLYILTSSEYRAKLRSLITRVLGYCKGVREYSP